jgi:hypothetical protein
VVEIPLRLAVGDVVDKSMTLGGATNAKQKHLLIPAQQ